MPNGGQLEVDPELTLRERKRRRTRAALIEAGRLLFEEHGYDQTTVADIAAAAEIGTRTFFAYFQSKEQLLFPESDARVKAAMSAIASRTAAQSPVQVLLRALEDTVADSDELVSELAQLRLRLIRDVPAVQARAMRLQAHAQHQIAVALGAAYPELDPVAAAALVGAFIGAASSAVQVLPPSPDRAERLRRAVASALGQS